MRSNLIALLILIMITVPAMAQETAPGDACGAAETDHIRQVGGVETSGILHLMRCDGTSWQQYMTILANGNVGIGTSTPSAVLDIEKSGMPDADRLIKVSEDGNVVFFVTARDDAMVSVGPFRDFRVCRTGGGNCLEIDPGGISAVDHANITIESRSDAGGGGPHGIRLWNDALLPSGRPMLIAGASSDEYFRIDDTGNIGINNTTPNAKLDVAGEVKVGNTGSSCVAAREGALRYSTANSCMELCDGLNWACMQAASCPNSLPNAFSFTDEVNATTSTLITSNIQQVTGVTGCTVEVSISGLGSPQYQTCSDASCTTLIQDWTSNVGSIQNNEYIRMRLTSSASGGVNNYADITIGARADRWNVVTQGDCSDPDPAIGTFCSDGTVYVGLSTDGGTKMYTTPCYYGRSWDGTQCTGFFIRPKWSNSGTIFNGITDSADGDGNTATIVGLSNADSPYTAAVFCDDLTFGGHTDWYLPGISEVPQVISATYDDKSEIVSSTEASTTGVRTSVTTRNKTDDFDVSCTRKD